MDLVKQEYWDESYSSHSFVELPEDNPIKQWINDIKLLKSQGTCIEIGTYPGGYINEFGKLGYEISGIDLTSRVIELSAIFTDKKYKVGTFVQSDFLNFCFPQKYDIVCSFGFIEHFIDYKLVIQKHADILGSGGVLLIVTPCFSSPVQLFLRRMMDNENLKRHNLKSMNPSDWASYLQNNGFDIIRKDYIGGFDFWIDNQKYNMLQKAAIKATFSLLPMLKKKFHKKSSIYSPYCGIIAVKK